MCSDNIHRAYHLIERALLAYISRLRAIKTYVEENLYRDKLFSPNYQA